jgi:diguanylate cyclase (GGDEF)-like protein
MEYQLRQVANDWKKITLSYIDQVDRVLKREEVLVQHRLESIGKGAIRMLLAVAETSPNSSFSDLRTSINKLISDVRIGRSGYVFVLDMNLNCLVCPQGIDDPLHRNVEIIDRTGIQDQLKNDMKSLLSGDSITLHHAWKDLKHGASREAKTNFSYSRNWNVIIGTTIHDSDYRSMELKPKLQNELRYKIADQRIGQDGYIWVINSRGDYIVSKDRFRDGENIYDEQTPEGSYPARELIKFAHEIGPEETGIYYYIWRNIGEEGFREKLVGLTYVKQWDWIIGVSAYFDEFLRGLEIIKRDIFLICGIFISLGSAIAYFLALYIARPIRHLQEISGMASRGNLNVEVDQKLLKHTDEVGNLSASFQTMINNLRVLLSEKDETARLLHEKNQQLALAHEQLEQEKELFHKQALTDPLTGMNNRRAFFELAEIEISRAHRRGDAVSIAMMDIDYFKQVNDTYGHDKGDEVLISLSEMMREHLRPEDVLGRMGGEEFAIAFALPIAKAFKVLNRLRKNIETFQPIKDKNEIRLTISAGLTEVRTDRETMEEALVRADKYLYQAKECGRNRVIYDHS